MKQTSRAGRDVADDGRPVVRARVRIPEVRALRLERLEGRLARVWERRLGVVVAPAGSGKTTLLAGYAGSAGVPVAWYRAETWDATPQVMLRHLHSSFGAALPADAGALLDARPWTSVEEAVAAIETMSGSRLLLVVDDLHALEGTDAEATLERLVAYAPERLAVIVASRTQPAFNLSRRRLEGTLLEITSEDLRFRSWEVERLFREVYRLSIPPQELATLARRTEGWVAGLQLFRLAVEGKSADERRRLLGQGSSSGRFVREYLARNVLTDLPPELRTFLVETCVLGRLSGTLCDGLLERTGSAAVLEELERRQIFTTQLDESTYRYHEVLRSHLEAILVETHGEVGTRDRYERAGRLLIAQEEIGDALVAYARAANWQAVDRLVRSRGERLVSEQPSATWLDALPPAFVRNDPWLVLASARRARDEGRWAQAADGFLSAEAAFGPNEGAAIARRERAAVVPWIADNPRPPIAADGPSFLRAAVARDPQSARTAAATLDDPWRSLVSGVGALSVGRPEDAIREFARAVDQPGASKAIGAGAVLGVAVATALVGGPDDGAERVDAATTSDASTGIQWLDRLARAAAVLGPAASRPSPAELASLQTSSVEAGDPWGELVICLLIGWDALRDDDLEAVQRFEQAAHAARQLGAGVLEAWALAFAAVAAMRADDERALELARGTDQAARTAAVSAPIALVEGALANPSGASVGQSGVRLPAPSRARDTPKPKGGSPAPALASPLIERVRVRCFGEFRLEVDGLTVADASIRPRARSVLHLLAVHAGDAVHRELVEAAIWPSETTGGAAARLHVAISSIRHLLQVNGGRAAGLRIDRDRETYRLVLPAGAVLDTRAFEDAVAVARARADAEDLEQATAAAGQAVALYGGPLLVEEGPAEWVLEPRERYHAMALEVIELQAALALRRHDPGLAVAACTDGLAIERYYDPFWRLLIEARVMAGDRGAAARAEAEYHGMLAQLGVTTMSATASR